MVKPSRIGHPTVKALLALKEGPRKHEKDANDAIFKISKLVVKETSEKAMFDGSLILRKGGKKVNEMNDVERIRAVAAILCCVPVEVKERILLYFNVHTVVEGEHVFLVMSEACPTFRHLCFVPLLKRLNLPLMECNTGGFKINFSACGSNNIHLSALELSKLHLGNMHEHWMCYQGKDCRLFDEEAGHAYRGYDIGGCKNYSVSKEINGQTVHFATCFDCSKFSKHGHLVGVEGKFASLQGVDDMRKKVAERDLDAEVKAQVETIIEEQEKQVREKLAKRKSQRTSHACTFRNVDGAFKCTSTGSTVYVKLVTVQKRMSEGSEFWDDVALAVNNNEKATCCRNCEKRLNPFVHTEKTTCAFRENNYLVGGVVPFQCTGANKSHLVKVTTVKSQMPTDSQFYGAVAVAVERNNDGWCCRGCRIRLLPKKACTFLVKDDLVGGVVLFQCTGTNDKSQFVKVTTVKSQMPADSPFCGTVDAAVERNKDGWCCRGCKSRLVTLPPPPRGDFFKPLSSKKQKVSK